MLQNLANVIGAIVYRYSNGAMAAAGSTLAAELSAAGLHVVEVARPKRD